MIWNFYCQIFNLLLIWIEKHNGVDKLCATWGSYWVCHPNPCYSNVLLKGRSHLLPVTQLIQSQISIILQTVAILFSVVGILQYEWYFLWVYYNMSDIFCGYITIWMRFSVGILQYEWDFLWVYYNMNEIFCGYITIWMRFSVGILQYEWDFLWVYNNMNEIFCGYITIWMRFSVGILQYEWDFLWVYYNMNEIFCGYITIWMRFAPEKTKKILIQTMNKFLKMIWFEKPNLTVNLKWQI